MSVLDTALKHLRAEASVLELWGMWNIPSLPLFPSPFWPEVIVPVRVPSLDQIEHLINIKINY